ncbi:uncharacterized protein LOC120259989 [Dioscorea cayenensis subsp. rotundata]|uniref:Uncharacterized protein LOC120259989 n=1 Tax=Dioscorea cayennensis subsp. rotundata TaxID=55577 RepID=A0AB40B8R5_DIOCR|nr:uncharacterized protein LOC120259989 [Dioscorea cayenensis subsp. rotundata]
MDPSWGGSKVIQFNYDPIRTLSWPIQSGRVSFFWKGVLTCLPALRNCISHEVSSGKDTLFWKDGWLNGIAPMNLWPEEFYTCRRPNGTIHELGHLLDEVPCIDNDLIDQVRAKVRRPDNLLGDKKKWRLTGNEIFSVKTFYNFLIDGGLRCPVSRFFWRGGWPKKINLFNWLAWKNKILSLENLTVRRCNRLPTDTCVLCHAGSESCDHLFIDCSYTKQVWEHFIRLLHFPSAPTSLKDLWGHWRTGLANKKRIFGDLVAKAIVWNICLARNDCIFNDNVLHINSLILKIARMIMSWCSSVSEGLREKMEAT